MSKLIGIDLGTANASVAVLEGRNPRILENDTGQRSTPAAIGVKPDGSLMIGDLALRQALTQPRTTLLGIKRLLGRRFDTAAVAELRRTSTAEIVPAPNGDAWVRMNGVEMSPPEVLAHLLRQLKRDAERSLGTAVSGAILTVPACFDDAQRQATLDAGEIAGFDVRMILNEPTAAALAFGFRKREAASHVAVFDLGAGTFDVSIIRIEPDTFQVLATSGESLLGGDDFDNRMADALIADLKVVHGIDYGYDIAARQRIKAAAETAKRELSVSLKTNLKVQYLGESPRGEPIHLERELTRAWMDSLTVDLVERLKQKCLLVMRDVGLEPEKIDQVISVGGMTRMGSVKEMVASVFKRQPAKGVNPEEIVALGAATHAGIISSPLREVLLLDVNPHTLGIRVQGNRLSPIIRRNVTLPVRETKTFATTEDNQDHVVIDIYQGENELASANRWLDELVIGELSPAPAGNILVSVSFSLDTEGILNVEAVESKDGKTTSKRVSASHGLSRDDVVRLAGRLRELPEPTLKP